MSARDYLPLLTDSRTIIRTLRQAFGAPKPPEVNTYEHGQTARMIDLVHPSRLSARVVGAREETPTTRTLVLAPVDRPLQYLPGQYVNVLAAVHGVSTSRALSISSAPNPRGELELTVKRQEDGFVSKHLVDRVEVGDLLTISGAEGDFHHSPVRDGEDLVFIAGGSGITPFMGMIEHLLMRRPDVRMHLIYASRDEREIIFRERLQRLAESHEQLSVVFVLSAPGESWSGERGRIDGEMIQRHLGRVERYSSFFICGPTGMQRSVKRDLEALGVDAGRVRVETYGVIDDATRRSERVFSLRLEGSDEVLLAPASEPLLNVLERAGHSVPALCRTGSCGSCRTKLVGGEVRRSSEPGMRGSDREAGFIHPCISHPASNLSLRVNCNASSAEPSTSAELGEVATEAPAPGVLSETEVPARESVASRLPWLKSLLAVGGLGLFVYLVASSGISMEMLADVGWTGFGLLLAISSVAILLDTLAWYFSLRHVARPGLARLLGLRLGGDALTNALPGGVVLGEPFKALMVKRWFGVSLTDSAASLMTVKFGLGITQSIFVLVGLLLIYPLLRDRSQELFGFVGAQYIGLAVIVGFQLVLLMLLFAVFRGRSFGTLARWLGRLPIPPLRRWLSSNGQRFAAVDESFAGVFRNNRRSLPVVFTVLMAGWLASSLESYVLLRALGQPVSLTTAFALESVGSMFRLLFFLVPSGIGGQDASFLALFRLFDLPRAAGGAFVLVKRAKELVWIGVGLILIVLFRKGRTVEGSVALAGVPASEEAASA